MSFRPFVVLAACLLPTSAACGGAIESTQPKPVADADEVPTLLSATSGSSLYVVAARASAATVVPFGLALPADASRYTITQLKVSADNRRVALVLRPKVGAPGWTNDTDTVVVGDGKTWTSLLQGPSYSLSYQASEDLGLFAVSTPCSSSGATRPIVLRADGQHVFDDGDCDAHHFVYAIAPNDAFFVLQDGTTALTLYPAEPGAAGVPLSPGGIVGSAFETSLIVFDTQENPSLGRWLDTRGAPLSVAGYEQYTGTPAGLLDIHGELFLLGDRKVGAVQAVPRGAQPQEIAAVVGDGLVVLMADPGSPARLVDAQGNVAGTYTADPPLTTPPPAGLQISSGSGARWLSKAAAWMLFENAYGTSPSDGGSGFQTYELSEDLWLLTDGAGKPAAKKISIRHVVTDQAIQRERTYVPSTDGKSVLYVEDATVHAIDVATGTDRVLSSNFQVGDLASRCDEGCVVF